MSIETMRGAIAQAKRIGEAHREAYIQEFGKVPVPGELGGWKATDWGKMRIDMERQLDLEFPGDENYLLRLTCRLTYYSSLCATDELI